MAPSKVILLACGSFNPPTNMHLRMFELARDNLNRLGQYSVIGGIISPVHEAYGKKDLIPGTFRCEMVKLALKSSDWIQISDWECSQETWSRTRRVLQYHQNLLNSVLNAGSDSPNNNLRNDVENGYDYSSWITNDIRNTAGPVQIKLLCGADLLESFATPGLWAEDDIETIIGQHGIVVITRQGSDPRKFIYESDILTKYQHNITIVTEWITNDVSSTKVRRALRRQESVKYLIEDSVIEFIQKHKLYGSILKSDIKYDSNLNQTLVVPANIYFMPSSPSDGNIMSASTSGQDIYLNLSPIPDEPLNPNVCSTPDLDVNGQIEYNHGKELLASETLLAEIEPTAEQENKKKVGFLEGASGDVKDEPKTPRKASKKYPKLGTTGKKVLKTESETNDGEIENRRGNSRLRRSKSDAVMTGGVSQEGETPCVRIQFTKDGIKASKCQETVRKRTKRSRRY